MVCGNIPFATDDQILAAKLHFRVPVSEEVQNLIHLCLRYRPEDRSSLKQILQHQWLKGPRDSGANQPIYIMQVKPRRATSPN